MIKGLGRREFIRNNLVAVAAAGSFFNAGKASAEKSKPPYSISDEPLTKEDWRKLKKEADRVFTKNRVKLEGGYLHVPNVDKYFSFFGWDSGWHSIAMTRLDPEIAASENEMLFSFQEENGRVSHNTKLPGVAGEPGLSTKFARLVGGSQYDEMGRSAMIDPPSYILAAEKISDIADYIEMCNAQPCDEVANCLDGRPEC